MSNRSWELAADAELVAVIARTHLPPELIEPWLALARPAVELVPAVADDAVVARLGGSPSLPLEAVWPTWDPYGALSFIGEILCTELRRFTLDIPLPSTGRLLFFYYDVLTETGESAAPWPLDGESFRRGRVVHVDDTQSCMTRAAPAGTKVYAAHTLTGRNVLTFPPREHPVLNDAFRDPALSARDWMRHPVNGAALFNALQARLSEPLRLVGGYPEPVQSPPEVEVAAAITGEWRISTGACEVEAARWTSLLQLSWDAEQQLWEDTGTLYWLVRRVTQAGGAPPETAFVWQDT